MRWVAGQCAPVQSLVAYYVAVLASTEPTGPKLYDEMTDEQRAEYLKAARLWFDELVRKWDVDGLGVEDFAVSCIASLRAQSPLFRYAIADSKPLRRIFQ